MKIYIKFPIRERINKLLQTLPLYISKANNPKKLYFQINIDVTDTIINNPTSLQRIRNVFKQYEISEEQYCIDISDNKSKVEAINCNILMNKEWDILLLASDDMIPMKKGYDDIIRTEMKLNYPDTDGVLWFYDGQREDLNTLVIAGKKYLNRFYTIEKPFKDSDTCNKQNNIIELKKHYIYHPSYVSLWCDNEFTKVADILGKQKYIPECIIVHEHPIWVLQQKPDSLMDVNNNKTIQLKDFENFDRRMRDGFGL